MTHLDVALANGITEAELSKGDLAVHSPIDGGLIGSLSMQSVAEAERAIARGTAAFRT